MLFPSVQQPPGQPIMPNTMDPTRQGEYQPCLSSSQHLSPPSSSPSTLTPGSSSACLSVCLSLFLGWCHLCHILLRVAQRVSCHVGPLLSLDRVVIH